MSANPTWKQISFEEIGITSHQGEVVTTRRILEQTFGPPSFDNPTGSNLASSTVEWDLQFSDGTLATIYDTEIFDDVTGEIVTPSLDGLYEWHVGGRDPESVSRILGALSQGQ